MKLKTTFAAAILLVYNVISYAQTELKKPEASQAASVHQRIGLTDIQINYHSPLSKGRTIMGNLVPYGEVWRAGANENTTISFSTDVKVEGKPVVAGTYGIHMIPGEKVWTLILSRNYYSWGSFFYNEKEDALRAQIQAHSAPMQEWLSYSFVQPQAQSAQVELRWENLQLLFLMEVDVPETVYQSMKKELVHVNGFFWQGHNQAALYCAQNNIHLEEASAWVEKSIRIQKNFSNLSTKALLMEKKGNTKESEALRQEALSIADEAQINAYGYELLGQGKNAEAKELFALNVKRYPKSWNAYDSLGEVLEASGDKKNSIIQYKTAYSKAPEGQKKRIEEILKRLESK